MRRTYMKETWETLQKPQICWTVCSHSLALSLKAFLISNIRKEHVVCTRSRAGEKWQQLSKSIITVRSSVTVLRCSMINRLINYVLLFSICLAKSGTFTRSLSIWPAWNTRVHWQFCLFKLHKLKQQMVVFVLFCIFVESARLWFVLSGTATLKSDIISLKQLYITVHYSHL